MISKIIALVIAMLLIVAAPVYGAITNPKAPVEFGAGDGEAAVIENAQDLSVVLNTIPSVSMYLENADITKLEGFEDFRSFTMVEDGYSIQKSKGSSYIYVDGEEEDEDGEPIQERMYVKYTSTTTNSHVLEICFTETGLYYHSIGELEVERENREIEDNDSTGDLVRIDRDVTVFDVEVYYSKDTVLVKYNKYDMMKQSRESYGGKWTDEEMPEEQEAALDIMDDALGKWLKIEELDEVDMDESDFANMTEEEQLALYKDMFIKEFCYEFSNTYLESIEQTNENNFNYLRKLSGFIINNIDKNFKKSGNTYTLKGTEDAEEAYLTAIMGSTGGYDLDDVTTKCKFNVNSTDISVTQSWNLDYNIEIYTVTTFKNVGNTIANVLDKDINTLYDALKKSVGEYFDEMMEEEGE